ncbi:uncharacterized protein LOC106142770 [Amyelois transitella]|uniref:uncharacterized protein LOC106142770 n=1 Tax=Amyelois transitella TaxID=680683 RepID=UPI00298FCBE5|nr:uncharacterized protein LOC106142770 [Amyelois transitella]
MSHTETDKLADINNKIALIRRVTEKCQFAVTQPVSLANPTVATMIFTDELNENIIKAREKRVAIEMNELSDNCEKQKKKVAAAPITSSGIHDVLYKNYVTYRSIIDQKSIDEELYKYKIYEYQTQILRSKGFVWRKISGNKCILIEDPWVQARRIKYLVDMKKFRDQGRTFAYVEEKVIPADAATLSQFQLGYHYLDWKNQSTVRIAISPQSGLLDFSVNNVSSNSDWLIKDICNHLRPSDVLVLEENLLKEEPLGKPPKPEATKADMIKWLEENNIPCTSTMHRAELYELIQMYSDRFNEKYLTEEIIKSKGIDIAKRPKGWAMLNYFEPIWNISALWQDVGDEGVTEKVTKRIETAVKHNRCGWTKFGDQLAQKEREVFEKDMELEEVVDKLLTMAKFEDMSDFDLPVVSVDDARIEEKCGSKFLKKL